MSTRERWARWFESKGGEWRNTVTQRTSVLIVGEEPGTEKLEQAKRKGIPTLHWYSFVAFGLAEERGPYRLQRIEPDVIADLSVIMASILEDLHGQTHTGSERSRRAYEYGLIAVESLLQSAFGEATGTAVP